MRPEPSFSNLPPELPEPGQPENREEPAWRLPLLFGLFVVLVLGLVLSFYLSPLQRGEDSLGGAPSGTETVPLVPPTPVVPPSPVAPETVKVYVVGAVHQPGVVTLPAGTRVDDAIRAVGGMLADADPLSVNLAKKIRDEDQIVVRSKSETRAMVQPRSSSVRPEGGFQEGVVSEPLGGSSEGEVILDEGSASASGRLSLNQASAEELAAGVKGLGPALSRQIVEHREMKGPFNTYEDLLEVPGIGPAKLEEIRSQIDL